MRMLRGREDRLVVVGVRSLYLFLRSWFPGHHHRQPPSRSPHPAFPRTATRLHLFRPRRQVTVTQEFPLAVLGSGVVNLLSQIAASAFRDPALLLPVNRPPFRKSLRSAYVQSRGVNNRGSMGAVGRGRGCCRALSFSWFAATEFADEVRINEVQIKTGRAALMGSPQQGTITSEEPRREPQLARLRCYLC